MFKVGDIIVLDKNKVFFKLPKEQLNIEKEIVSITKVESNEDLEYPEDTGIRYIWKYPDNNGKDFYSGWGPDPEFLCYKLKENNP